MNIITDITTGLTVIAGSLVAEATVDPVTHYAGLIEKFGIMAVMLGYFLVRDYFQRRADAAEKASLIGKLDNLELFIRDKLISHLDNSTDAVKSCDKTHKKLLVALEDKAPCLREAAGKAKERLKEDTDTQ